MELLLVGGRINELPYIKVAHNKHIINKQTLYTSQLLEIASENNVKFDGIVILDQGIDQSLEEVKADLEMLKRTYDKQVFVLTNNLELKLQLSNIQVHFVEKLRISQDEYDKFFEKITYERFIVKESNIRNEFIQEKEKH